MSSLSPKGENFFLEVLHEVRALTSIKRLSSSLRRIEYQKATAKCYWKTWPSPRDQMFSQQMLCMPCTLGSLGSRFARNQLNNEVSIQVERKVTTLIKTARKKKKKNHYTRCRIYKTVYCFYFLCFARSSSYRIWLRKEEMTLLVFEMCASL